MRAPRTRVGDLRVIGTTAGSLALLSTFGDDAVRAMFERHGPAFAQAGIDLASLRRHVALARSAGCGVLSDNVSEGVVSVGICLRGPGAPFAVAAIAAAKSRMNAERLRMLQQALRSLQGDAGVS